MSNEGENLDPDASAAAMSAPPKPTPSTVYEIGLVMSGAISAGAYTAGVLDFLFQALSEWERLRILDLAANPAIPQVPRHQVKIKAMGGASAGGICAAIAATMLHEPFQPVDNYSPPSHDPESSWTRQPNCLQNKLFQSWVNQIDISRMVEDTDLKQTGVVQSVLDSTVITEIAGRVVPPQAAGATMTRSYITDPLSVVLSVTNLTGVPYAFELNSNQNRTTEVRRMHADQFEFQYGTNLNSDQGIFKLKPGAFTEFGWQILRDAAMATSAFPIGLASRPMSRQRGYYASLDWNTVEILYGTLTDSVKTGAAVASVPPAYYSVVTETKLPPAFTPNQVDSFQPLSFMAVDGGVTNNCPFQRVHDLVSNGEFNPRSRELAYRSVIIIDPFPLSAERNDEPSETVIDVMKVASRTFGAMMNQLRFRPEEIALAVDEQIYSRYLIAPDRNMPTLDPKYAIACGSLSGFGGFLCHRFREHDFQLGRRNCQRFLSDHFLLPADHGLFGDWAKNHPDDVRMHRVPKVGSKSGTPGGTEMLGMLPIIPLLGTASEQNEVQKPEWPSMTAAEYDRFLNGVHPWRVDRWFSNAKVVPGLADRLDQVFSYLNTGENISWWPARRLLSGLWSTTLKKQLLQSIDGVILKDLADFKLLDAELTKRSSS